MGSEKNAVLHTCIKLSVANTKGRLGRVDEGDPDNLDEAKMPARISGSASQHIDMEEYVSDGSGSHETDTSTAGAETGDHVDAGNEFFNDDDDEEERYGNESSIIMDVEDHPVSIQKSCTLFFGIAY